MPCLLEMLEETKSKDVLKYWSTLVKLLGKHLHIGAELINKVMKVVEQVKLVEVMELMVVLERVEVVDAVELVEDV